MTVIRPFKSLFVLIFFIVFLSSGLYAIPSSVQITTPTGGSYVGGNISVIVYAYGSYTITNVKLYLESTLIANNVRSATSVRTTNVANFNTMNPNASYKLIAVAYDTYGPKTVTNIVTKPGMNLAGKGANLVTGGCFFKVWAPSATSIYIIGDFNGWSTSANQMNVSNNWWYGFVPGAANNQKYGYYLNSTEKCDPYARQLVWDSGAGKRRSVIKDATFTWASFTVPTLNKLLVYELGTRVWGSYLNVVSNLDYLTNLGVTAIELMPVHQVPTPGGCWGYNPIGMFAPHNDYGTYDNFKTMVNECHKKGVAVIVDVVYNHMEGEILWQYDGWHAQSAAYTCGICGFNGYDGGRYYYNQMAEYGHGYNYWHTDWGHSRPNYGTAEVHDYLVDNAKYWISEMNCDGLRFDSTCNIHHLQNGGGEQIAAGVTLLNDINTAVKSAKSGAFTIAEDLQNNTGVTGSWLNFSSQWSASFVHGTRAEIESTSPSMANLKNYIQWIDNGDQCKLVKYVDSHDEAANGHSRMHQEIAGYTGSTPNAPNYYSMKKNIIGHALSVLSPGIPMFLQGDECMTAGYFYDGDSMPNNFNKTYATSTYSGIVKAFGDINKLKKNYPGLQGGSVNVYHVNDSSQKVIAFQRWMNGGGSDDVLVIINLSDTAYSGYWIGAPYSGTWYCRYNSDWTGYNSGFGNYGGATLNTVASSCDGMAQHLELSIGRMSVQVYTR